MTAHQRLRQAIDLEELRLRASVPPDRLNAVRAIIRIRDRLADVAAGGPEPDLITGRRLPDLGGNKALQLVFQATALAGETHGTPSHADLDSWARWFLASCASVVEAQLVLDHHDSGFMRLVDDANGGFDAWIATKRMPTTWRERADIDWWATHLARPRESGSQLWEAGGGGAEPGDALWYRRVADELVEAMAWQLGYPASAVIGGCAIGTYRDVLGWLIAWVLGGRDRQEEVEPQPESFLTTAVARDLGLDQALARQAILAFTLDEGGAAWHASVPGIAAAPIVRVAADRLVPSLYGLTTEPLLFLARELRRRDAQVYHNAAHLREAVFRQDLYALFNDKRFVTSKGRIELRREGGTIRTDIDAAIFDRKTGALALFELKSQDPFARSTAERERQRDNFLFAGRQVAGVLDWVKRHGANELLARIDPHTARTFRAHKVYPFVLGRYLAHVGDSPTPDRRAAWGSWPHILRLVDGQPVRAKVASPIASLHSRLASDDSSTPPLADLPSREIPLGAVRLGVHPSWAAFQARSSGHGQSHERP